MSITQLRTWQWFNVLSAIVALTLNGLANGLPLFGNTTGDLSQMYPNLFVPAGLTFAIWGLIYLLIIGLLIYQFRDAWSPSTRPQVMGLVSALKPWFALNLLANALWIVVWHAQWVPLSVIVMLVLLGSLILLNKRLRARKDIAPSSERWFARVCISVYLGWISVATIANVTTLAIDLGIDGGTLAPGLTTAMVGIAGLLGVVFMVKRGDWAYLLVIAWALYGIFLKRSAAVDSPQIILTGVFISAGLLLAALVYHVILQKNKPTL